MRPSPPDTQFLLPAFDQYVSAAARHAKRLLPGDGTWRHRIKGSRVEVVIEPFVRAPVWVRRVTGQEAERLAAFLGCTFSLAWKS